jgi:hypothetical protein
MKQMMAILKEEYKDYEVKPNQKELLVEITQKWAEHKAALLASA